MKRGCAAAARGLLARPRRVRRARASRAAGAHLHRLSEQSDRRALPGGGHRRGHARRAGPGGAGRGLPCLRAARASCRGCRSSRTCVVHAHRVQARPRRHPPGLPRRPPGVDRANSTRCARPTTSTCSRRRRRLFVLERLEVLEEQAASIRADREALRQGARSAARRDGLSVRGELLPGARARRRRAPTRRCAGRACWCATSRPAPEELPAHHRRHARRKPYTAHRHARSADEPHRRSRRATPRRPRSG